MKPFSREQLSGKRPVKVEWVPLGDLDPANGPDGGVYVREMSARDGDSYQSSMMRRIEGRKLDFEMDLSTSRTNLCLRTICDEQGVRLYGDDDGDELGEHMREPIVDRIYIAAAKLNGIRKTEADALKNSSVPAIGSAGSTS